MIPAAVIAHTSTGRLRIRVPSRKGNLAVLKSYGDQLAACPGVLSIEVNPGTGSILLLHQTTVRKIAEYARSGGLFSLEEQKSSRVPSAELHRNLGETFKSIDRQIQTLTDGDMDLSGFAVAALIVAGSAQILTGNAGPIPWSAAYWYAYNLHSKTAKEGEKK
ncbi:MAG: HMA2 domain-containing protein [Nitrospirota bacterium]